MGIDRDLMERGILMRDSRIYFAFAFLLACASPAHAKVISDVTYSTLPDGKEMKLDIAIPEGNGPFPAIVAVHGGAWRFGSRKELDGWITFLANEGYVAATISYRLVPDGKFPDPLVDVKTAVRYLRANAAKYNLDPERIGAVGFSAGGHLVNLLGTVGPDAGFEGKEYPEQSSKVQGVVSFFGPTDLALYGHDESAQNAIFEPLLGSRFKKDATAYAKASPISYVNKNAAPTLFLHGTRDWIVPIEHSRAMHKKMSDAGATSELLEIEGGNHGFTGNGALKANHAMLDFFAKVLKK